MKVFAPLRILQLQISLAHQQSRDVSCEGLEHPTTFTSNVRGPWESQGGSWGDTPSIFSEST